jgi:hypothetical protein
MGESWLLLLMHACMSEDGARALTCCMVHMLSI